MFGFNKTCHVCGIDLQKQFIIKEIGKNFCSKEHARIYVTRKSNMQKTTNEKHGHGCC